MARTLRWSFVMKLTSFLVPLAVALSVSFPAFAQDDAPANASAEPKSIVSLGLERFGGLAYAKASESDGNESASLFTMGLGVGTINPYAVPRVGADYVLESGLSLGASAGFTRWSGSSANGASSQDVGSILLYTFTPRVGYRIPLSDRVDLTPRVGITLAGASLSSGSGNSSASVFSFGAGADAPFAFRVTDSFNILAGPAFDITLAANFSEENQSGATTTSSSSDVKGTLWSLQGWVGVGGYL